MQSFPEVIDNIVFQKFTFSIPKIAENVYPKSHPGKVTKKITDRKFSKI